MAKGTKLAYLQQDFDFRWSRSAIDTMLDEVPAEEYAEAEAKMKAIAGANGIA